MTQDNYSYPTPAELVELEASGITVRYSVYHWWEHRIVIATPTFVSDNNTRILVEDNRVFIPNQPFYLAINGLFFYEDGLDYLLPDPINSYYQLAYPDFAKAVHEWGLAYTWGSHIGLAFFQNNKRGKLPAYTEAPIELIAHTDKIRFHPDAILWGLKPITTLD